jgi:hypothetical protein
MVEVTGDVIDKIINIVRSGGGTVFEQDGYINFCGVRNNVTNDTFNDVLYIYWKENGVFKCVKTSGFTTKPGEKSVHNLNRDGNASGVAIVKEGWHPNVWHLGIHGPNSSNPHEALRQTKDVTEPITITRDKTQYGKSGAYELRVFEDTTECGYPFTNMHRSKDPQGNSVNGWSAGCQVFQYKSEFDEMLRMAEYAATKGQNMFSYFLTNKTVFDGNGVVDNNGGTPYNFNQSHFGGSIGKTTNGSLYSNNVSGLGGVGSSGSYSSTTYNGEGSALSFGNDVIFGQVFPADDNNRYIEMSSEDISVIQYSEPVLRVEELNISNKSMSTMGVMPDKISYHVPVVFINDFMIPQTNITNFCLDYTSFAPQVMVEFVDMTNEMLSTNIPKPGSYIKVFIGGYGDEKYYKPIRQDFVITNINKTNKTGGEYQNYPNSGNPIKYKLTGILNVPLGFRKMTWSSSKINARQAMFNISNTVGIGFATNFATNSDVDVMRWINTQNKSYYDFMREITQHSCYSPYTFFTSFIDQYYVLNYVECRRLLSHGGKKDDLPQMIYNCIMPEMGERTEQESSNGLDNGDQKLSYYFITNSSEFKGWTNYIEEYFELNDGYSIISDGYSKVLTYSDKCGFDNLMSKNYQFLLTPIDNIKRDGDKKIISLPEQVTKDTYIPLNLRQTTNSAYVETQKIYDNPTAAESRVDLGEVDTSNNYPLYFYSSIQNDFQMKNFKKCGLSIRLQNYNPAITRYSRIWVDIYDMNMNSLTQIRKNSNVDRMPESTAKEYLKDKNENIISFADEMEKDNEYQAYNRSLSGWYVVTDMKISYNNVKDFKGNTYKKLQTQLILNRIEYKPTFRSEYEMARNAIEKYKNDNISEDIMCSGDILQ